MTEKLNVTPLWEHLQKQDKPILLYGMGDGADKIIAVLESFGLTYADTFASDEFVRGHFFHGKRVLRLSEAEEKYGDFIILMTFAVHDRKTMDYVRLLSEKYEFYSPTVPVVGGGLFTDTYIKENEELFDRAYDLLADEQSREDYLNVLRYKISGDVRYLFNAHSEKLRIYDEFFHLSNREVIVDLGAYDGDTIREFTAVTGGEYKKIIAFEPDEKNFAKLMRKTGEYPDIEYHNIGAWDRKETLYFSKKAGRNSRQEQSGIPVSFDSVDNIVKDEVTFIKMDIEGAELRALRGAKGVIQKYRPKLYVCAYHRNEDLFTLPLMIHELYGGYRIYFRQHPYVPAWEGNLYAVDGEKSSGA